MIDRSILRLYVEILLFVTRGGLSRSVAVSAEVVATGRDVVTSEVAIVGEELCVTTLRYYQVVGDERRAWNLSEAQPTYTLSWPDYPSDLLDRPRIQGEIVVIRRRRNGEARVTLVVSEGPRQLTRITRQHSRLRRTRPPPPSRCELSNQSENAPLGCACV